VFFVRNRAGLEVKCVALGPQGPCASHKGRWCIALRGQTAPVLFGSSRVSLFARFGPLCLKMLNPNLNPLILEHVWDF